MEGATGIRKGGDSEKQRKSPLGLEGDFKRGGKEESRNRIIENYTRFIFDQYCSLTLLVRCELSNR